MLTASSTASTDATDGTVTLDEKKRCLPLSPFDILMLLDERPGYPMCFFIETQVSGNLFFDQLKAAVKTAVKRHPRMNSYARYRSGKWEWKEADKLCEIIQLKSKDDFEGQINAFRPFDIRSEPGIRIIVNSSGNHRWSIILQAHHSVCDGLAALEFLGDIWSLYDGKEPRSFRSIGSLKKCRPNSEESDGQDSITNRDQLRETLSFATFNPSSLASSSYRKNSADFSKPFHSFTVPGTVVSNLRHRASRTGVTLNDLLIAASMFTIKEWNEKRGKPGNRIRITMPVSLRPPRERRPADNQIGYAFLDRSPTQLDKRQETVNSIAEASRWIQKSGAAGMFLFALGLFKNCTWLLKLITRLPVCFSTAVVSNIGNVQVRMRARVSKVDGRDAPGGISITNIIAVPPIRPGTALSVGITAYCNQLTITTMIDRRRFTSTDGLELTSILQAHVERLGCSE